eukprot:TRINITY_DN75573_c0_g1_i1.p1 TRINITY_DN75573_c0_g1~~TRINITY_DN75573_c0_g1_i1.p1  ORF type:complete len:525 (+),score=75.13 TRINITY_DN75573_c0_g1_i1:206-1576(+)
MAFAVNCKGHEKTKMISQPSLNVKCRMKFGVDSPVRIHLPRSEIASHVAEVLSSGCVPLDVGESSRSGANFAISADGKWVLKRIKSDEVASLKDLAGLSGQEYWVKSQMPNGRPWYWQRSARRKYDALVEAGLEPGDFYWTSTECESPKETKTKSTKHLIKQEGLEEGSYEGKSEETLQASRWCLTKEDPAFGYANQFSKPSLLVPFTLLHEQSRTVVMPSFFYDANQIASSLAPQEPGFDKFDVKPISVRRSEERGPLLAKLLELGWTPANDPDLMCNMGQSIVSKGVVPCWDHLRAMLSEDQNFLNAGRPYEHIDYSLVFLIAHWKGHEAAEQLEKSVTTQFPPNCVASTRASAGTTVLCTYLLDYLMQKTWLRKAESIYKGGKFDNYADNVDKLLACVGNLQASYCQRYVEQACEDASMASNATRAEPPSWWNEYCAQKDEAKTDAMTDAMTL